MQKSGKMDSCLHDNSSPAALAFPAVLPVPRSRRTCLPGPGAARPGHREPSWLSPAGPGRWPAGAAQQGLAHLCLCRKARRHARVWSDGAQPGGTGAQPGGMVPGGCEPELATASGQQHAGQGLRAHVEEKPGQAPKLLCLLPSPLPSPRRQRWVSAAAEEPRLGWQTRGTKQSPPEVLSTWSAAWDSPARPEFLPREARPRQRGLSPLRPHCPWVLLPSLCLPWDGPDSLSFSRNAARVIAPERIVSYTGFRKTLTWWRVLLQNPSSWWRGTLGTCTIATCRETFSIDKKRLLEDLEERHFSTSHTFTATARLGVRGRTLQARSKTGTTTVSFTTF